MFLSAYLLIALAQIPPAQGLDATNALDRMQVSVDPHALTLDWADTEERVRGTVTPPRPRAGEEMTVAVNVGSFEGAEFDGPVTLTLKPVGKIGKGDVATVTRAKGEKSWTHVFTPSETGDHVLEVAFFSTRRKAARAKINIEDPRVPLWLSASLAGAVVIFLIGGGVMLVLRRRSASAQVSGEKPGAPPPTNPETGPPASALADDAARAKDES